MKTGHSGDSRPYFPLYAADWLSGQRVLGMSLAVQGAFIKALCIQWRDGSMPDKEMAWARIFPTLTAEEMADLMSAFPGGKNPRLERERALLDQRSAAQSAGARMTNAKRSPSARSARRSTPRSTVAPPSHSESESESESYSESRASPSEKPPRPRAPRTGPHAELIQFWEQRWLETRMTPYAVETKDGVAAAAILKLAKGDLGEAKRRAESMLTNGDPWIAQKASLPLLRSQWNQCAIRIVPKPKTALQNTLDGLAAMGMNATKELA